MRKPLFGAKGLNGFIGATRRAAQLTRRPGLEFSPHWIDRLVVATGRRFNGRRIRWRDVMAHPHGWVLGPREFGHFREALRTPDTKVRIAPPEFLARARELLAEPAARPPEGYPFQLANRRHRHSMNSWLNDLPGLHPSGKGSDVVIHPEDARAIGITDGDRVRVSSRVGKVELTATVDDTPRPGVVIIDHGWGSRVFDPLGGSPPESFGVNRNLLVDAEPVDPLSQTPALSSTHVAVEKLD